MENFLVAVLLALVGINHSAVYGQVGHDLKKHYEFLSPPDLTHRLVKRDVHKNSRSSQHIQELQFNTLGRDFLLELKPNNEIIHSSFNAYEVDSDGNESHIKIGHQGLYKGKVSGDDHSKVHAHLDDNGVLTATIRTKNETYYIEPSRQHFKDNSLGKMIAYKASDMKPVLKNQPNVNPHKIPSTSSGAPQDAPDPNRKKSFQRSKRASSKDQRSRALRPHKTLCSLLLVADYRFHRTIGGGNSQCTTNYLISLIDRINQIFLNTEWKGKPDEVGFDGMGFVIKKIVVHTEPTKTKNDELHYNMKNDTWEVRNLLDVFSRDPTHKEFCLAHLFTDTKSQDDNPGYAYVGSPRRDNVGGICNTGYLKNGHLLYVNSGLSSCRNRYGNLITKREAELVTAHQFGHNCGAVHDPEDLPECNPNGSEGGSYLMRRSYVSGYDINNEKFSPCSLRSIRKVLLTKSERCFLEPEESVCGNLVVEDGEECDAGHLGTDDLDQCCRSDCTLRQGALCSDRNSACCRSCQFLPAGQKCQDTKEELHTDGNRTVETAFIVNISGNCSYPSAVSTSHQNSATIFIGGYTIGTIIVSFRNSN